MKTIDISTPEMQEMMKKVTILQIHKNMVEFYSDISIACKYVNIPCFAGERKVIENKYQYNFGA